MLAWTIFSVAGPAVLLESHWGRRWVNKGTFIPGTVPSQQLEMPRDTHGIRHSICFTQQTSNTPHMPAAGSASSQGRPPQQRPAHLEYQYHQQLHLLSACSCDQGIVATGGNASSTGRQTRQQPRCSLLIRMLLMLLTGGNSADFAD